jgi:predicted ATPase
LRIGLHTGTPLVTDEGYVGDDVHFAARVAASGHGGQVLLSTWTRELIDGHLLTDLGEHRLKDIDGAVSIYQLGDEIFPRLKTISNTNLPRPASSFLGREREQSDVVRELQSGTRLLTLTGPGGSGKTRLAVEAAATLVPEYKAGVFWVGLASLREPSLVMDEIAQTIGAKDGLAPHIGEREMLLLLDNLEQVIEAAPDLSGLLQTCPYLTLLCTSRELLRVQGEVEYEVPPLASSEAVSLFCERSRLEPSEELPELCARLDNLPLAVELAAARTKALSPAQILERLSQRLDLLKGGRDADPRQQTLRTTIQWSYDLLSIEEQRLFRALSVFSGGCTLEAAEEVADASLDTLQSLVEKSLLRFTDSRYWMLETIREYAGGRLEEAGDAGRVNERHRDWFVSLAEQADMSSRGGDRMWFDLLEAENDNARVAVDAARRLGQTDVELRLATHLWQFWAERGHVGEGVRVLEDALDRSLDQPPRAILGRCYLRNMTSRSDYSTLLSEAEAVAAAAARDGDVFTQVQALTMIGLIDGTRGRWADAEVAFERALELAADVYPAQEGEIVAWQLISALYGPLPSDDGILRCKRAYDSASGNPKVQAFALVERAPLEAMRGEFDTARLLLAQGWDMLRELDLAVYAANTAQEAYLVAMLADDAARAVEDLGAAYELLEEMGERGFLSTIAGYLADACYAVGDLDGSWRYSEVCAAAAADDDLLSQGLWRSVQAKLLARRELAERAEQHARDAFALVAQTDFGNLPGDRLVDLADVLVLIGKRPEAVAALVDALERYERKGNLVAAERVRRDLEELVAQGAAG